MSKYVEENHNRSKNHIDWLKYCYEELEYVRHNSLKKLNVTFNEGSDYDFLKTATNDKKLLIKDSVGKTTKYDLNHMSLLFEVINYIQNSITDELKTIDVQTYPDEVDE